jgi:hypothetical protein
MNKLKFQYVLFDFEGAKPNILFLLLLLLLFKTKLKSFFFWVVFKLLFFKLFYL